jgi:hypothetical protein
MIFPVTLLWGESLAPQLRCVPENSGDSDRLNYFYGMNFKYFDTNFIHQQMNR